MPSHTLLSVVLMASLDWTSAHTNLKGKTAKKEEIHPDEKGDAVTSIQVLSPRHILPAKTLPCMSSAIVAPLLGSTVPHQRQAAQALAN